MYEGFVVGVLRTLLGILLQRVRAWRGLSGWTSMESKA